ncbi:MAG: hypothetical protein QOI88_3256 [Gammaproteobacteria bacterium]|jgi:hypothetical protein|nr:hypothetical protein [Gammaproteobacteria bacterium]MEA3142643.1 hypothetical protein [Gammaproteobacteria bacterium]
MQSPLGRHGTFAVTTVESLREFLSRLISSRLGRVSVVTATQQEVLFGPSALTTERPIPANHDRCRMWESHRLFLKSPGVTVRVNGGAT